jgi:hypothetical protein
VHGCGTGSRSRRVGRSLKTRLARDDSRSRRRQNERRLTVVSTRKTAARSTASLTRSPGPSERGQPRAELCAPRPWRHLGSVWESAAEQVGSGRQPKLQGRAASSSRHLTEAPSTVTSCVAILFEDMRVTRDGPVLRLGRLAPSLPSVLPGRAPNRCVRTLVSGVGERRTARSCGRIPAVTCTGGNDPNPLPAVSSIYRVSCRCGTGNNSFN